PQVARTGRGGGGAQLVGAGLLVGVVDRRRQLRVELLDVPVPEIHGHGAGAASLDRGGDLERVGGRAGDDGQLPDAFLDPAEGDLGAGDAFAWRFGRGDDEILAVGRIPVRDLVGERG